MRLKLFKTLWGDAGTFADAINSAQKNGFDGLEAVPPDEKTSHQWRKQLDETNLDFIAEIPTTGDYVPRRDATVQEHLQSLRDGLHSARILKARLVNCVGGCDAWSTQQSIEFFGAAMEMAQDFGLPIAFETHRSRSTFTPWATRDLLIQLPAMRLTCDFSHWCVVLERLPDSEADIMNLCFERALHIHARIGYAQGPQVSDPAAPEYQSELTAHEDWWRKIWQRQIERGQDVSTMTPEWGPDGYAPTLPHTQMPVADINKINVWMAARQRTRFANFLGEIDL